MWKRDGNRAHLVLVKLYLLNITWLTTVMPKLHKIGFLTSSVMTIMAMTMTRKKIQHPLHVGRAYIIECGGTRLRRRLLASILILFFCSVSVVGQSTHEEV